MHNKEYQYAKETITHFSRHQILGNGNGFFIQTQTEKISDPPQDNKCPASEKRIRDILGKTVYQRIKASF
jgi:hypothetical protein